MFFSNTERFENLERLTVVQKVNSPVSIQFRMDYSTTCPVTKQESTEETNPPKKRVTLLQYLLGWYR